MSLVGFPLLLIPLAIVNIFVFLMPAVSFSDPLITVHLMSGAVWKATFADVLLALGIVLILFEVLKASRPQSRYFVDHLLSFLAFAAATAEFLLLPQFATSVMFLLAVMMAVDFLAGVTLLLRRNAAVKAARVTPSAAPAVPEERVAPVGAPPSPPPAPSAPESASSQEPGAEPAAPVAPLQPPSEPQSPPVVNDPVR